MEITDLFLSRNRDYYFCCVQTGSTGSKLTTGPGLLWSRWRRCDAVDTCARWQSSKFFARCASQSFIFLRDMDTHQYETETVNSFGIMSLRQILEYWSQDYMFNGRLLESTGMRLVTCAVREHQLSVYGHGATLCGELRPPDLVLSASTRMAYAEEPPAVVRGCIKWRPIRCRWAWQGWYLLGEWPDGSRMITYACLTRRRITLTHIASTLSWSAFMSLSMFFLFLMLFYIFTLVLVFI